MTKRKVLTAFAEKATTPEFPFSSPPSPSFPSPSFPFSLFCCVEDIMSESEGSRVVGEVMGEVMGEVVGGGRERELRRKEKI